MTVTVSVKTHAHTALVTVGDQPEVTVPARTTRDFHAHGDVNVSVKEGDAPAEQEAPTDSHLPLDPNDALLGASAATEEDNTAQETRED